MKVFDFEDIQLLPKRCVIDSRSNCKTSVNLGKYSFKIPVVPANMRTIIDEKLALQLAQKGYFYIMHRFEIDNVAFVKKAHQQKLIASISVGVKKDCKQVIDNLVKNDLIPEFITIDIAHGHADSVRDMIYYIRDRMGDKTFIIAGNIATPEAASDLER